MESIMLQTEETLIDWDLRDEEDSKKYNIEKKGEEIFKISIVLSQVFFIS
jgi:hypothetical protein